MSPLKFLAYLIILCFEKRVAKENAIDRLKYFGTPKFLPPKIVWAGYTIGAPPGCGPVWDKSKEKEFKQYIISRFLLILFVVLLYSNQPRLTRTFALGFMHLAIFRHSTIFYKTRSH